MLAIQIPTIFSDTSLPTILPDPLLAGSNDGVRFLFDLSTPISYPTQNYSGNGLPVNDISQHANGAIVSSAGQVVPFLGGGFDYSSVTARSQYISSSSSSLSAIWADTNQYFLMSVYVKLPTLANWNSGTAICPIVTSSLHGYNTPETEFVVIAIVTGGAISIRRQNNGGTGLDALLLTPNTAHYGNIVQISIWRNSTAQTAQIYNASATVTGSLAVGVPNTGNFGSLPVYFGVAPCFWNSFPTPATSFRIYRGFIESLTMSGRTPTAVLLADYNNCINRFS